jgi:hypothetical protein
MSADVPMITQERAYTSPIWYTPSAVEHFSYGSTSDSGGYPQFLCFRG